MSRLRVGTIGSLTALAAVVAAALATTAGARADNTPHHQVVIPRDSSDWKVTQVVGPVTISRSFSTDPQSNGNPIWVFHLDAQSGRTAQSARLVLPLGTFGIEPLGHRGSTVVSWSWWVRNQTTADYVALSVIDSAGTIVPLGASHNIYDNNIRTVPAPPTVFRDEHSSIRDAVVEDSLRNGRSAPLGPVTALALDFQIPHHQEVWLGPVRFDSDSTSTTSPSSSTPGKQATLPGGKFFVVDLNGDGIVEVITPWFTNNKVWKYNASLRKFELEPRKDVLARNAPFYRMCAADLDHDGDVDLVALDPDMETLQILTQSVKGFRARSVRIPLPEPLCKAMTLALGDDDRDGNLELFVGYQTLSAAGTTPCIFRLAGAGDGSFGPPRGIPVKRAPKVDGTYYLTLVDLDNDRNPDLITADGNNVYVFPGTGSGTYREPVRVVDFNKDGPNGFFRDIAVADLTGDGLQDLYVSKWTENPAHERGRNFLAINKGEFVFDEEAAAWGIEGTPKTSDACITELDGTPGPDLLLLEDSQIISYDLGPLSDPGHSARALPSRLITREASVLLGASMFSCQDLDRDGSVELILSGEFGPYIYRLPNSGPVWSVNVGGLGRQALRSGAMLEFSPHRWSTPLQSNVRCWQEPCLVSTGSTLKVRNAGGDNGPPLTGGPGQYRQVDLASLGDHAPLQSLLLFLRWRLHLVGEYIESGWESDWAKGSAILIGGAITLSVLWTRRRLQRKREADTLWLELLKRVGLSTHAEFRPRIANFAVLVREALRIPDTPSGHQQSNDRFLKESQSRLPREFLESMQETLLIASELGIEGTESARRALQTLWSIHQSAAPNWSRLYEAARTLESRLSLFQELLADRYRCDAAAVHEHARLRYESSAGTEFEYRIDAAEVSDRFPMQASDLYVCLDELFRNALKKRPRPGRIVVSVGAAGLKAVYIRVWDNGAGRTTESQRHDRDGSGLGLAQLNTLLAHYGGKVTLQDAPEGGVIAEIRLPRFDLV